MTFVPKNPQMTPRARELRKEMTPQERHLWYDFLRDYPVRFRRQRVIESFIADFYCSAALLVIEIDGAHHFTPQGLAYDQERSAIFETYGIQVLRFTNREIDTRFEVVCNQICHVTETRIKLISQQPGKEHPLSPWRDSACPRDPLSHPQATDSSPQETPSVIRKRLTAPPKGEP